MDFKEKNAYLWHMIIRENCGINYCDERPYKNRIVVMDMEMILKLQIHNYTLSIYWICYCYCIFKYIINKMPS